MAEAVISTGAISLTGTNEDALETAVREHARLAYRIAYSVLRNHHDAEDGTQETFMRVLRYRRKLEGLRNRKTWLVQIAWRVAVEGRKRAHEMPVDAADVDMATSQLRSQVASAEECTLGREMAALLGSLVSALPLQLRDALELSTVQELASAEIAVVLGTSESAVRSRLFRARQVLKEKLAELEGKNGFRR